MKALSPSTPWRQKSSPNSGFLRASHALWRHICKPQGRNRCFFHSLMPIPALCQRGCQISRQFLGGSLLRKVPISGFYTGTTLRSIWLGSSWISWHHNAGAPAVQSGSGALWLFPLPDLKIRALWHLYLFQIGLSSLGTHNKGYCHAEVCCSIQEMARVPWKMCTAQGRLSGKNWWNIFCLNASFISQNDYSLLCCNTPRITRWSHRHPNVTKSW